MFGCRGGSWGVERACTGLLLRQAQALEGVFRVKLGDAFLKDLIQVVLLLHFFLCEAQRCDGI